MIKNPKEKIRKSDSILKKDPVVELAISEERVQKIDESIKKHHSKPKKKTVVNNDIFPVVNRSNGLEPFYTSMNHLQELFRDISDRYVIDFHQRIDSDSIEIRVMDLDTDRHISNNISILTLVSIPNISRYIDTVVTNMVEQLQRAERIPNENRHE